MKLLILQNKLKEGLNIIERIVGKSLSLPILNNTLIKAQKNFISLSATNLEIGINWQSLAKVETEGELVVPVRLLTNFFSLLANKQVILEKKDNFLVLEYDNIKTQIKCFSPEDFPILPQVSRENFIELEALPFCQGLEQLVDIVSPSQTRPEISGIYFSLQKEIIKLAATDSFRLGEKTLFFDKKSVFSKSLTDEISFIFPQKTAKEIINVFGGKEEEIKLYFSPNQILFENETTETSHPRIQIISRLIEGEYPIYQDIIPKKYQTQVVLTKDEFLNQIKIAALFSGKINEVKFKINPQKEEIEIFSQNPDLGQHRSFLKGKVKGEPLEISFNHKFLIDGLLTVKSSQISLELSGQEGPAVLKPVGDQTYLYVVMPIKAS